MASPVQISVKNLARLIGTPKAPCIIDVRISEDIKLDPQHIPTAIHCRHLDIDTLVEQLNGVKAVVYCQKGLKLSEGAAAILRSHGVDAEVLSGGHFAWRDAGEPLVPNTLMPPRNQHGQTVWVTRVRPKIDRIACPWLIKRFIDPNAQFLFVSASSVEAVAEKFNATPFDVENVFWTHRNADCTFDTMVKEFKLQTPALNKLAEIVCAADTNTLPNVPEAAGLLALSLGLSRMYSDDLQQLDAGMLIYDALYRWCRDASNETHDWPADTKSATRKL